MRAQATVSRVRLAGARSAAIELVRAQPVSAATAAAAGPPRRASTSSRSAGKRLARAEPRPAPRRRPRARPRPARALAVVLRELGRAAAADFLVELGQLAAHRHRALGIERGEQRERRGQAPRRLERHERLGGVAPAGARARRACAAESRRSTSARPAARRRRARSARRSAPAAPRPRNPPPMHARTSAKPGSEISGMPASETSATVSPARIRATSSRARARSLCSCKLTSRAPDAVAIEQHARVARVLAGDHVGLAQRREHAQRHVLEVADRRRAHEQSPVRRRVACGYGVIAQI